MAGIVALVIITVIGELIYELFRMVGEDFRELCQDGFSSAKDFFEKKRRPEVDEEISIGVPSEKSNSPSSIYFESEYSLIAFEDVPPPAYCTELKGNR